MRSKNLQNQIALFAALAAIAVLGRVVPHMANFAPVAAVGLLAGTLFRSRWVGLVLPLVALAVSDYFFMGTYKWEEMFFVYVGSCVPSLMGTWLRRPLRNEDAPAWKRFATRGLRISGAATASAVFFFLVSNLGSWLFSGMYAFTYDGLVACYTLAIPFFRNTLAADLMFSFLLFGAWHLIAQATAHKARYAHENTLFGS